MEEQDATPCDMKVPVLSIQEGMDYIYIGGLPKGRKGCLYRVLFLVIDEPSKQEKVCCLALNGPDKGTRFTCSPANFAKRYIAAQN